MPIDDLRTFLRLTSDAASSLLVTCRSTDQAESVAAGVRSAMGPTSYVTTFRDTFQAMVSWIEIQKRPIPIVLGLISLVAVFSVISTLLIAVVEKTRSMAILITLGMTPQRIMGIVLARAVSIGVLGSIIGTGVAYAALMAQRTWQIVRLDGAIYYVRDVPVSLAPEPFVLIPAISITLCILVSIVPMVIASRVRPARALRF
jgi:lipoprotein-releasing system permease protein